MKNFRQFGLSLNYKQTALKILNTRGISELELKMGGDLSNQNYENALRLYIDFKENSKLALVLKYPHNRPRFWRLLFKQQRNSSYGSNPEWNRHFKSYLFCGRLSKNNFQSI